MSHMRGSEGYEQEVASSDDDQDLDVGRYKKRPRLDPDDYIEKVVGPRSESDSNTEEDFQEIFSTVRTDRKSRHEAGMKVEWSDEEPDDAYEKFKNRKKIDAKRKKASRKAQKAMVGRKAEAYNNTATKPKEKVWGDEADYEMMEDSLPDYLQVRKKEFDSNLERLEQAGLRLSPTYENIDFSDLGPLKALRERPQFDVEPSRPYRDVTLPYSRGVIPASIAQYLRDYQVEGVSFLHELFVYQKGGILGDDMGLGKTVQVAAFLTVAFGKTGDERDAKRMRKIRRDKDKKWYPRALVICPGSVIENWKQELNRWGWWHVDGYHGSEKEEVLAAVSAGRLEVMITTYATYKNHREKINLVEWDVVVADECHQLKERTSQTTKAMNEVNALCRIGLTGTAIQNRYEELWTLLNWTNPGKFGPISTWKSSISDPLQIGQSHDATVHQLSVARRTAKKLVTNLLPEFFLRRMKSLIAHQLPKKSDRVVFCPLTDLQKDAYERFLDSPQVELVKTASDLCDCNSGKKSGWCCNKYLSDGTTKWQVLVFPVISLLQKLSNHLALLIPSATDPHDKQCRDLEFMKVMVPDRWRDLYANRESLINLSNPEFCGKWKILKKLLRYWHGNGDKVLVFSHSVKLLKMLRHLFQNTSYNVSYLDGSLSYEDRQKEVDDFNSDPGQFVFLISTKAGGVGLNITSANKVVIMDPNWNPSYDLQAQDRAYRIGQLRDVEVFRLVSQGTVEEIVYARQIYKQQQANIGYNASMERRYFKGVQNQQGHKGEIFGLLNLLTFHADDVVLRDIVNKTNVAEAKAGVSMVGVDMDDDDDEDNPLRGDVEVEDAAMSQLAALLTEDGDDNKRKKAKARPKTDAVQAILASAGVSYTHENSEVVGSSKVEAQLSRRAEETGNDISVGDERLFASSQPGNDDSDDVGSVGIAAKYTYHPPAEVKLRQFCTMAETFDFESATDFALFVEGWTAEKRRDCLRTFYKRRVEVLRRLRNYEDRVAMGGGYVGVYDGVGTGEIVSGAGAAAAAAGVASGDEDDLETYDLDG